MVWSTLSVSRADTMSAAWFEQTFSRLSITEQKLFPSWWLSSGLIEAARRDDGAAAVWPAFTEALKFLALLIANGMLLQLLAGWLAARCYRLGYGQLSGRGSRPASAPHQLDRPGGW